MTKGLSLCHVSLCHVSLCHDPPKGLIIYFAVSPKELHDGIWFEIAF